jgi:hypothetical protein
MARWTAAFGATVAVLALATLGVGRTILSAATPNATWSQARGVAAEFFRSINEQRYDDSCRLLSRRFYRQHRIRDRQTCVAGLRIGFLSSPEIHARIGKITRERDRVVLRAIANGAPGQIVLVREGGYFKIENVEGG